MPRMNLVEIVYIGNSGDIEIAHDRRRWPFKNRKPVRVPQDLADKLLRQENFLRAEDLLRTVLERYPTPCMIIARRWGAIGDLMMLRATVAAFCRQHPGYRFILRCEERFSGIFIADNLWAGLMPIGTGNGPGLDTPVHTFDQVAEQDHRGVQRSRIDLFMETMTNEKLSITREDWNLPIPEKTQAWVKDWASRRSLLREQRSRPLIALQVHGSGAMKSMPDRQIKALSERLTRLGTVVLIEHDERKVWQGERIVSMPGRDALHGIELLKLCDLCVCFDSGVLWMAHCAATPVLCIMGPTRPAQRIAYHPLYPEKARAVLLNERIELNGKVGCPPCFEAAEACKQSYACMQKQPDAILEHIAAQAESMMTGDVKLPVLA